jgi:hypothetical protein
MTLECVWGRAQVDGVVRGSDAGSWGQPVQKYWIAYELFHFLPRPQSQNRVINLLITQADRHPAYEAHVCTKFTRTILMPGQ